MTHLDLSDEQLSVLDDCYADSFLAPDRLPYTKQYEVLCERFRERTGLQINRRYARRALCNLREANKLARKGRKTSRGTTMIKVNGFFDADDRPVADHTGRSRTTTRYRAARIGESRGALARWGPARHLQ